MMNRKAKKILSMLLTMVLLFSFSVTAAYADSSNVRVSVNNRLVTFNSDLGSPFINSNDRTMIPFRAVANFMTAVDVDWDDYAKEASFWKYWFPVYDGEQYYVTVAARFPIGTNQAWQDIWIYDEDENLVSAYSHFTQMDTLSYIVNSRTYAPIRYLAEALYSSVGWNDASRTVLINEPGNLAAAFLESEYNTPEHFITGDYVARQYAYIYLRRVYSDFDPNLAYLGKKQGYLADETYDTKGWLFNCVQPGELIYIYVNDMGETWISSDDSNYDLWY